jgi:hypothetical protein
VESQKKANWDQFPKAEEIFSWIKDLTQWGHRKTGTPEGRKSAAYIKDKMTAFGLSDVHIERYPTRCMIVKDYALNIGGDDVACFYINGTNHGEETGRFQFGTKGEKVEFVYIGKGLPEDFEHIDVKGKVVVASIYLPETETSSQAEWFDDPFIYDPEDNLNKKSRKADIYSPGVWPANFYYAQLHGAAGFVGILENYMDDPYLYNEDYTENGYPFGCEYMTLPGLWISRSEGQKVKEKFAHADILSGSMKVDTLYEKRDGLDVVGMLPGQSDEIVMVHSHHDAVFEGAVQDASGISEMLALAKYFSSVPAEERKKTLMFVATDTHYTDYAANIGFIKRRRQENKKIILDIAIEHIGKEAALDDHYNLYETGRIEPKLFYVSEPKLHEFVKQTIVRYDLGSAVEALVPVGKGLDREYHFHQDEVISDAYFINESGIPVVSMVCGEQYLFHISDTPDRIPVEALEPVGMAFADITNEAMRVL